MLPIVVPLGNGIEGAHTSEHKAAAAKFDGLAVFDFGDEVFQNRSVEA